MSSPPPEGMARAYVNITNGPSRGLVRVWTGEVFEAKAKVGLPAPLVPRAVRLHVERGIRAPIREWADVDWSDPPEYVMAPGIEDSHGDTLDDYPCVWMYSDGTWGYAGDHQDYSGVGLARYKPHNSNPEVLVRVWQREEAQDISGRRSGKAEAARRWVEETGARVIRQEFHGEWYAGPTPISEVDWAAVHRGELVPPRMVEVPEKSPHGARLRGMDASRAGVVVYRDGSCGPFSLGFKREAADAAHYTVGGSLLGYRTVKGWKTVSVAPDAQGVGTHCPSESEATGAPKKPQAGERPASTRGSWVDGKWVPNRDDAAEEWVEKSHMPYDQYIARRTERDVRPDLTAICQDAQRRRDLFDRTVPFRVGDIPPVKMSEEFQEYLRRQQEGRR